MKFISATHDRDFSCHASHIVPLEHEIRLAVGVFHGAEPGLNSIGSPRRVPSRRDDQAVVRGIPMQLGAWKSAAVSLEAGLLKGNGVCANGRRPSVRGGAVLPFSTILAAQAASWTLKVPLTRMESGLCRSCMTVAAEEDIASGLTHCQAAHHWD
jgi:hypothetical protein